MINNANASLKVLGLDLMQSGFFSVLPWISMSLSANVGGWIADALVPKIGVTAVRKTMQTVKLLLDALIFKNHKYRAGTIENTMNLGVWTVLQRSSYQNSSDCNLIDCTICYCQTQMQCVRILIMICRAS